jgi:ribosomal protein S18 acetylase RimI-like enzyme
MITNRITMLEDVDELVDVVLVTMPDDPQWPYRFPYRHQYPEDHRSFTRMLYTKFIVPTNDDWVVMIVEEQTPGSSKPVIVAFSVWCSAYANKRKHGPSYEPRNRESLLEIPTSSIRANQVPPLRKAPGEVARNGGSTRRDANPAHVRAFRESSDLCDKLHLDTYEDDQLVLQILGTHPDHRRCGHGLSLCRWGMNLASRDGVVLTVQASPLGLLLYKSLGFTTLGECVMQVPGEEDKVPFWAMVWHPSKD